MNKSVVRNSVKRSINYVLTDSFVSAVMTDITTTLPSSEWEYASDLLDSYIQSMLTRISARKEDL